MKPDQIKKALKAKTEEGQSFNLKDLLNSGSTLLNLACSGKMSGAFPKGHYVFLVGDSSSGKTFLSLTCMAEAARNPEFDGYRFIYDNGENGALMDFTKFFGKKMAQRVEPPRREKGEPSHSSTIEEFYYNIFDICEQGKPFIYVLDSMDVLDSESAEKKFRKQKNAFFKNKNKGDGQEEEKVAGSFGDGKAKKNSSDLRKIIPKIKKLKSILIIINQTRDNVGALWGDKKTRSGGHALKFYAALEMWSFVQERLYKKVNGVPYQVGILCGVKVKKNRLTGKEWSINIPIYWSSGFDDVGSIIRFLVEKGHWEKSGKKLEASTKITAPEFDHTGTVESLVKKIEQDGRERELKALVKEIWSDIEERLEVKRKPRYE